jgi:Phage tail assembly chaperone protein
VPSGALVNATVEEALAAGASQEAVDAALNAQALSELKARRTAALTASDWTMMSDAALSPAKVEAWRAYRRDLRDLPATLAKAKLSARDALTDPNLWPEVPPTGGSKPQSKDEK